MSGCWPLMRRYCCIMGVWAPRLSEVSEVMSGSVLDPPGDVGAPRLVDGHHGVEVSNLLDQGGHPGDFQRETRARCGLRLPGGQPGVPIVRVHELHQVLAEVQETVGRV